MILAAALAAAALAADPARGDVRVAVELPDLPRTVVTGDGRAQDLVVRVVGETAVVESRNGEAVLAGEGCIVLTAGSVACAQPVLDVRLGGGRDRATVTTDRDQPRGDAEQADRIDGGPGRDVLQVDGDGFVTGGGGVDRLLGGPGEQLFDDDPREIDGGPGFDVARTDTDAAVGDYAGVEGLVSAGEGLTLAGDGGANELVGGAGTDLLRGGAGADRLFAGASDRAECGPGRDTVFATVLRRPPEDCERIALVTPDAGTLAFLEIGDRLRVDCRLANCRGRVTVDGRARAFRGDATFGARAPRRVRIRVGAEAIVGFGTSTARGTYVLSRPVRAGRRGRAARPGAG